MKSSLKQFGGVFSSDSPTKLTPERFPASSQFSFLISGFSDVQGFHNTRQQVVWQKRCVATNATTLCDTSNIRDHAPPQTESSRCRAWIAGGECCRKIRVGRRVVTSSSCTWQQLAFFCICIIFVFVLYFY